jgi:hypothetical protein
MVALLTELSAEAPRLSPRHGGRRVNAWSMSHKRRLVRVPGTSGR